MSCQFLNVGIKNTGADIAINANTRTLKIDLIFSADYLGNINTN